MLTISQEISSKTCALTFKNDKTCTLINDDREIDIDMSKLTGNQKWQMYCSGEKKRGY